MADRRKGDASWGVRVFLALGIAIVARFTYDLHVDPRGDETAAFSAALIIYMGVGLALVSRANARKKARAAEEAHAREAADAAEAQRREAAAAEAARRQKEGEAHRRKVEAIEEETRERMVGELQGCSDLNSYLQSLMASNGGTRPERSLVALLERIGFRDWVGELPQLDLDHLVSSWGWYVRQGTTTTEVSAHRRALALRVESALNVWILLAAAEMSGVVSAEDDLGSRIAAIFSHMGKALPVESEYRRHIYDLMRDCGAPGGEWRCRVEFADAAEGTPLPFSVREQFEANAAEGLFVVCVQVPTPEAFAILDPPDADAGGREATAYAARVALVLARAALGSGGGIRRVVVNCVLDLDNRASTVLSVDVDDKGLSLLADACQTADMEGFVATGVVRMEPWRDDGADPEAATCEGAGWLRTWRAPLWTSSPEVSPSSRWLEPTLDDRPCPPGVLSATGAHIYRDLGIVDGVHSMWLKARFGLGETVHDAVSRLEALRASTDDPWVGEACVRTESALVAGDVDQSDLDAMAGVYVYGSDLAALNDRFRAAAYGGESGSPADPEELEAIARAYEAAFAPLFAGEVCRDGGDEVWRYFNSIPERVRYDIDHSDDPRRVRLVPDSWYDGLFNLGDLLVRLGRTQELDGVLDAMARLSPGGSTTTHARATLLSGAGRGAEAEATVLSYLRFPNSVHGLRLVIHDLAQVEWHLGRHRRAALAEAYLVKGLMWAVDRADARKALDAMVSSDTSLQTVRGMRTSQIVEALRGEGIDVPDYPNIGRLVSWEFAAAAACVDAGAFVIADELLRDVSLCLASDALRAIEASLREPHDVEGVPYGG